MEVYPSSSAARASARPRRRRRGSIRIRWGARNRPRRWEPPGKPQRAPPRRSISPLRTSPRRIRDERRTHRGARGEAPRGRDARRRRKRRWRTCRWSCQWGATRATTWLRRARARRQRTDAGGYRAERFASWRAIRGRERPRGRRERGAASRARRDAHDDPPAARVTHLARRVLSGLEAPFPCAVSLEP